MQFNFDDAGEVKWWWWLLPMIGPSVAGVGVKRDPSNLSSRYSVFCRLCLTQSKQ